MNKIKEALFSSRDPTFQKKKIPIIILLLFIGVMILTQNRSPEEQTVIKSDVQDEAAEITDLERQLEKKISSLLKKSLGTSKVDVMITLGSGERLIYERNESIQHDTGEEHRDDQQSVSGRKSTTSEVVIGQASGAEPVLKYVEKPMVSGVLIAAEGSESAGIKKRIIDAVSKALDVSTHRVAVIPYE
ncbi:hypothetical protein JMA_21050 [Jeotgalibacillus malaysiensis]|uniref:Stage III sporulation protein AG n=1 Tax=Jeotgalibacillus malaysiensis TaxID=1508404 RepID=A0A0B5ARX6_9BACL|nr:hypothetical protein [Jeotgalibacillus malaysiensis]AJD91422.1 hypothetical protein JMA_21050 [Jeotgalibacillus malaysiensis]